MKNKELKCRKTLDACFGTTVFTLQEAQMDDYPMMKNDVINESIQDMFG